MNICIYVVVFPGPILQPLILYIFYGFKHLLRLYMLHVCPRNL